MGGQVFKWSPTECLKRFQDSRLFPEEILQPACFPDVRDGVSGVITYLPALTRTPALAVRMRAVDDLDTSTPSVHSEELCHLPQDPTPPLFTGGPPSSPQLGHWEAATGAGRLRGVGISPSSGFTGFRRQAAGPPLVLGWDGNKGRGALVLFLRHLRVKGL